MNQINLIPVEFNGRTAMVEAATEQQAAYIRSLVAKIEAKKVIGPKKPTRTNDPVKAHQQQLAKARDILATLELGQMSKGAASTHIPSLLIWAGR